MTNRDNITRIPIICKDCGAKGIRYQEDAWGSFTLEDAKEYYYWISEGMWGNAETQLEQCEDCYPLSAKNIMEDRGDSFFTTGPLVKIYNQAKDLHEMGLTDGEAIEVVIGQLRDED